MACKHWQGDARDAPPGAFSSDGLGYMHHARGSSRGGVMIMIMIMIMMEMEMGIEI
jgi:hypothetical protein